MIEYVIYKNPDDRILKKACQFLGKGELICLPTDTNWIIVADPYKKDAVEKLYQLKKAEKNKHFSLLCDSISRASEVAIISDSCFRLMKRAIPGHYTFILKASRDIQKVLKASKTDHEIGLRFSPNTVVNKLIGMYNKSLISTNLTPEILEIESGDPVYSTLIEESPISHLISLIIDPDEIDFVGKSSIISFINDVPEVIREGAGDISFFT
jgi:tRNA threonylcarbamoyl adenosine modification protein (Sua5/YciO/YrdC/YwlC family)